jgi:hypothetical protein
MRIPNSSSPVIPLYVYEERTDHNEEKQARREPLQNPPVLQYRAVSLHEEKNPYFDSGNLLSSLSRYAPSSNLEPAAVISPVYEADSNVYQTFDQLFSQARAAYSRFSSDSTHSGKQAGRYVDTSV